MSGQNEDAAWAEIIANYGDRPVLDDNLLDKSRIDEARIDESLFDESRLDEPRLDESILDGPVDEPVPDPPPVRPTLRQPEPEPPAQHPELDDAWAEERFVPPPPPPLPRLPFDRLLAWAGVFVSPLVLLLATVLSLDLPTIVAWLLVGGFLGGFGYLVSQMPRGPRDPFDDGARL